MHEVVVMAVRAAVKAAMMILRPISMMRFFVFIAYTSLPIKD